MVHLERKWNGNGWGMEGDGGCTRHEALARLTIASKPHETKGMVNKRKKPLGKNQKKKKLEEPNPWVLPFLP